MRAFYSDTFVLPLPQGHRFPMAKYERLREGLLAQGVLEPSQLSVPEPVGWADLRLAHSSAYIQAIAGGHLSDAEQRRIGFPWSPQMVERSRRSVGATLAAARSVTEGELIAANLAGGTHHAFADHGSGYCIFNDVAVAALVLLRDRLVERVTIVDCDVHQGDGTASIFRADARVFTMSFHGATNFPFRKETSNLDVTFADGAEDDEYLSALAIHLPEVLDESRPDIVFYLAGADPYAGDRLGKLALSVEGLRQRDRFVFEQCGARRIPVVVTMSGGYCPDIDAIVAIHVNTIKEAARSLRCR